MEPENDDQWSWWQQNRMATSGFPTDPVPTSPPMESPIDSGIAQQGEPTPGGNDPVRMALIGLVAVLAVGLAGVSYQRWGTADSTVAAAIATTTSATPDSTVAVTSTAEPEPSTSPPTTVESSTTIAPTTVVVSTSVVQGIDSPPSAPLDVEVFSTNSTGAEIRWRSEECVGSRYQVAQFEAGGGGFPDTDRCWFNHVILAGDPAFSPPLSPNTTYVVVIQAVGENGAESEPVEVQFTTTS